MPSSKSGWTYAQKASFTKAVLFAIRWIAYLGFVQPAPDVYLLDIRLHIRYHCTRSTAVDTCAIWRLYYIYFGYRSFIYRINYREINVHRTRMKQTLTRLRQRLRSVPNTKI